VTPNVTRVLAAALLITAAANAQTIARHGMTPAGYQSTFNDLTAQGYRPIQVSGYTNNGAERYAALFTKTPAGAWVAKHGLTSSEFQSYFNWLGSLGYRLTWISGYEVAGNERYAAIWEQKTGGAWYAFYGMTSAGYQQTFNTYAQQGYRLTHLNAYTIGGASRYAAIFEQQAGPAWVAKHGLTSAEFQQEFQNLTSQGYRPRQISGHNVGGTDYYAAIFEASVGPMWSARHGVPESWYQNVTRVTSRFISPRSLQAVEHEKTASGPTPSSHRANSTQFVKK
jgi:hypothetical protein